MNRPEVTHYIKTELERGVNREKITQALIGSGWSEAEISEAFQGVTVESGENLQQKPKRGMSGWLKALIILGVIVIALPLATIAFTIFTSLGAARDHGQDATIRSEVLQFRSESESYADNNNGIYAGICTSSTFEGIFSSSEEETTIHCFDNENAWALSASLSGGRFYCIDSRGSAHETREALTDNETVCPAQIVE